MEKSAGNETMVDVSDMFIVSPTAQRIRLEPGTVYEGEILVTNPASAKADFEYVVSVAPYSVADEEYSADLSDVTPWSDMVNWITLDKDTGVLAPNQSDHVGFRVAVPADAKPGGQYATLLVGSLASKNVSSDDVQVNNVYEIASILYARVAGEIKREGSILENSFPSFVTDLPLTTKVRLKNDGNIHENAKVTVTVKNVLTGEDIYTDISKGSMLTDIVMPDTTREIPRDIAGLPFVGVYEVSQAVDYMGQYSTETHQVIVCPIWVIVVAVLVVLAVTGGIFAACRHHRKKRLRKMAL